MSKDKDYRRMINSARWHKLRREKVERNPLCQDCEERGYLKATEEVHHMVPVERGKTREEKERLMFDFNNLRSLCHECHKARHIEMRSHVRAEVVRKRAERVKRLVEQWLGDSVEQLSQELEVSRRILGRNEQIKKKQGREKRFQKKSRSKF